MRANFCIIFEYRNAAGPEHLKVSNTKYAKEIRSQFVYDIKGDELTQILWLETKYVGRFEINQVIVC